MSDETVNDLKQFITATVSQLATRLEVDIEQLHHRMGARFDDLDLKVDTIADAHAIMLEDHELSIEQLQAELVI